MAAINEVTDLTLDGDVAVITLNSPPVNALSFNVRDGLYKGFKAAIADPAARAIVLICAGPHVHRRRRHLRVRRGGRRAPACSRSRR